MLNADRFLASDLTDLIETERAGAEGLIAQLIRDFSDRLETYLRDMEQAQGSLNFEDLNLHAHTMKSSTRVLGMRAASEICKEMESLAREGVYNPQNLLRLREEIFPALAELSSFESRRKKD